MVALLLAGFCRRRFASLGRTVDVLNQVADGDPTARLAVGGGVLARSPPVYGGLDRIGAAIGTVNFSIFDTAGHELRAGLAESRRRPWRRPPVHERRTHPMVTGSAGDHGRWRLSGYSSASRRPAHLPARRQWLVQAMVRSLVDTIVERAARSGAAAARYTIGGELLRERRADGVTSLERAALSSSWGE